MSAAYDRLRELLANETFPHVYTHKFIGLKTPGFQASVEEMVLRFPRARLITQRPSGGEKYLAYTYELEAETIEEIIELLQATAGLDDLKLIL